MNKKVVIILMAGVVMFAGCKNKHAQTPQTETPQTEVTEPTKQEPTPQEPVVTEPVVTEPVKEEPQPAEPKEETKPTKPAETVYTPQHKCAYGKGTVTVNYKNIKITSPVEVYYLADSIIIASAKPVLGIEAYRLEATKTSARLYEKLNRRYAEMTYDEISAEARRKVTFPMVEQMVEEVGLTYPIGKDTTITYAGVTANLKLQQRTIDQPFSVSRLSSNGYSKTTLKALLSK